MHQVRIIRIILREEHKILKKEKITEKQSLILT